MTTLNIQAGMAAINNAKIYFEIAGEGQPFVMIHAGVADNRQWNNEFEYFANHYRVLRYDMRGYGKSEPVEGEYTLLADLTALLDHLHLDGPAILMGCSMGGGLAMNFALTHPSRAKALIMVGSAPNGLELDVPSSSKFAEAEKAYEAGDLDLTCEIEIQIWFDGEGRTLDQVNPAMRKLAYEMNRIALAHEAKGLGKRLPDTEVPAAQRLSELHLPILIIVGAQDTAYLLAASNYMFYTLSSAQKATIEDAAHLPNMDHPDEFQKIVGAFLKRAAG